MKAAVDAELAGDRYDVVISHLIRMAQYLPAAGPARRWIDFTDAISLYHTRRTHLRYRVSSSSIINWIEHRRVLPYERAMIAKADRSLFISRADADSAAGAGHGERVAVVPNGVDLEQFPFAGGGYDRDRIIFLGNMRTFPNTDAAHFFATRVFPLVLRARPGATFHIVGTQPSRPVRRLHNGRDIVVTGRVPSVVPHLRDAALLVAPMRACSGVQNKILESLAVGTPVVATTMGAEGLEDAPLVVADTAEGIAQAALEIMENPQRRRDLSAAGRSYIERTCTWDTTLAPLDRLLADDLSGPRPAHDPTAPSSSIVVGR
jgi:glycosyltransferase involved in cell wall biosynthesis